MCLIVEAVLLQKEGSFYTLIRNRMMWNKNTGVVYRLALLRVESRRADHFTKIAVEMY